MRDADSILYTAPGLHEHPRELEKQLTRAYPPSSLVPETLKGKEGSLMPIYEYECNECGNQFEALVRRIDEKVSCVACGSEEAVFEEQHF